MAGGFDQATRIIIQRRDNLASVLALTGSSVDPVIDLQPHPLLSGNSNGDSFWIVSKLVEKDNDKHELTSLFHLMLVNKPQRFAVLAMSIFDDRSHPSYVSDEEVDTPPGLLTFASDGCLNISMKDRNGALVGYLSGDMDYLIVKARGFDKINKIPFDIDLKLTALGPILYYLGMGIIPFPGGKNFEFALPTMNTSGVITIDKTEYSVFGDSWLDREWGDFAPAKWTWICIQPGNGVQVAVWDQQKYPDDKYPNSPTTFVSEQAFATVLSGNGDLHLVRATITEGALAQSGLYRKTWKVKIGDNLGSFDVDAGPIEQSIVSSVAPRLETRCVAGGQYNGQSVDKAFAFVETGYIKP